MYIFWVSIFIIFYTYTGYAIIPYLYIVFKKSKSIGFATEDFTPPVSFIVAAYNEEDVIEQKIINSLSQNYPAGNIEYIFITDGSTDDTSDIIQQYPSVKLMHNSTRKGKTAALNRAVEAASNNIIIISDANTSLNEDAVRNITKHYQLQNVGGVAGEKKVVSEEAKNEIGTGEGLYWKYESFLKKIDSDFYSVVGAAGELFSFRKDLFEPLPENVILDDFVISMRIAEKGFRIVYESKACATEAASNSIEDERKRKVRIAAGGFQAIAMLPAAFAFWKHFKLSYLYISHRVMRWAAVPFCLILAFFSNVFLFLMSINFFYKFFFILQLICYTAALIETLLIAKSRSFKPFRLPYYFLFMNVCVIQGFFRYISKGQSAIWEKAGRAKQILKTK